jgi:hypothetical protein
MDISLQQLRQVIGVRVNYLEQVWQIIEVLEDGPSLVLESLHPHRVVQQDKFGDGYRRVPYRMTVPVLSIDRAALHPDFLALDLA